MSQAKKNFYNYLCYQKLIIRGNLGRFYWFLRTGLVTNCDFRSVILNICCFENLSDKILQDGQRFWQLFDLQA